ncbi:MAG: cyclase family protein [Candidatus Dormibacteraceae bacterium]
MPQIVDLSQPLSPRSPRSTDHPEVTFAAVRTFARHGLSARTIHASLHAGTHVDAPSLYMPEGDTIDKVPISRLYGPGVIVDVQKEQWGVITPDDLERAGNIHEGDIVVLYTGWSRYYGRDEETYALKQPGLEKAAVDWFVQKRVNFVCADMASGEHVFMRLSQWKSIRPDIFGEVQVDPVRFPHAYAHKELFRNGILMADNIGGDVATILGRRCTIAIGMAKYEGVEGAPARIFAVVD